MIIECPRCHFKQPEDQYCAQCGVDMKAYKPKETPGKSGLLGSGLFVFVVVLILGFGLSRLAFNKNSNQTWSQRISSVNFKSAKSTSQKNESNSEAHQTDSSSTNYDKVSNEPPAVEVIKPSESELEKLANPPTTSATTTKDVSDSDIRLHSPFEKKNSVHMVVSFIEIHREVLNSWVQESQKQNLFQSGTDFSIGLIRDFSNSNSDSLKFLKTIDSRFEINKSQKIWIGENTQNNSEASGYQMVISPSAKSDNFSLGKFEITKFIRSVPKDSFPIDFEIKKKGLFFIFGPGLLSYLESEKNLQSEAPFQIFQSVDYLNQKTDLVITIEYKE